MKIWKWEIKDTMKIWKWEIATKKLIIISSIAIPVLLASIITPIAIVNSIKKKADKHTHAPTKIEYLAPNCDTAGNNEYYFCDGCDKYFKDAECSTETTIEAEKLTAKGHSPNADDGDCTTAITCSVCDTVTTEARANHTPNADDGDCTTDITCSACGEVTTVGESTHTGGNATCTEKA